MDIPDFIRGHYIVTVWYSVLIPDVIPFPIPLVPPVF